MSEREILSRVPCGLKCLTATGQCPHLRGPADTRIYELYACDRYCANGEMASPPRKKGKQLFKSTACRKGLLRSRAPTWFESKEATDE